MASIAFDLHFPQIPLILEPECMRSVLQQFLCKPIGVKSPRLLVEKCIIGEKRHKPGKSFIVSYHLDMRNVETGVVFEQVLTAKLYQQGKCLAEFNPQPIKQWQSNFEIPAFSHLPELGMMIWVFPNDLKLMHLADFLNQAFLKTYFEERSCAFGFADSNQITSIALDVLHYLPERSCMIRYQVAYTNNMKPAESQNLIVYGKHYRDDSGSDVYSTMHQIATQISKSARPLHYDPENKILWQSHVHGKPFSWERQNIVQIPAQINKIADCVANFHLCTLQTQGQYDVATIEQQLMETLQTTAELNSGLSGRIRHLVNNLLTQQSEMDWSSVRKTPLHMDLKPQNFLIIDAGEAILIDLDCVTNGDHLIDIGSLIANFYLNGLRAEYSVAEVDAIVAILIQQYLTVIPWSVDQARLNWYTAAAFVHEVLRRSIRQCDEQRMQHSEVYLALSERYLMLSKMGC